MLCAFIGRVCCLSAVFLSRLPTVHVQSIHPLFSQGYLVRSLPDRDLPGLVQFDLLHLRNISIPKLIIYLCTLLQHNSGLTQ